MGLPWGWKDLCLFMLFGSFLSLILDKCILTMIVLLTCIFIFRRRSMVTGLCLCILKMALLWLWFTSHIAAHVPGCSTCSKPAYDTRDTISQSIITHRPVLKKRRRKLENRSHLRSSHFVVLLSSFSGKWEINGLNVFWMSYTYWIKKVSRKLCRCLTWGGLH